MTTAGRRVSVAGLLGAVLLLAPGCGSDDADARWSSPAKGPARLPDLAPVPPSDIHTKKTDDGWTVEFSSTVVNVGEGDFHATATKGPVDAWTVTQDIAHDEGAEHVRTSAELVWAGDGHEHWHINRYVTYHLFALDAQGQPTGEERTDHKIGFCIYDFRRGDVGMGPDKPVYNRAGCGRRDSTHLVMGLTPGWADYYSWNLPGQSISIDGLPDGHYRIFAVADEAGQFREERVDNNKTWVDFTLSTDEQDTRYALVDQVGQAPE